MPRLSPTSRTDSLRSPVGDTNVIELHDPGEHDDHATVSRADALARMAEAEDTLRAIGTGEVDALVIGDKGHDRRVFTLSTADRPYRMFVENMRDGAATLSSTGLILYANRRLAELVSFARETIVGSPLSTFLADGDTTIGLEAMRATGALGANVELDLVRADGSLLPVLVGISPLEVDGDHLICLTFTDLSVQKAQDREIARLGVAQAKRMADLQDVQAALTRQATHDTLTGLPNRALLVDRIEQALAQSERTGHCTAIYFVDLDRFKQVNDTRGHAAGDALLRRVGAQLVDTMRTMDTIARLGGDEFIVLAPEVDSPRHAVDMGARIVIELARDTGVLDGGGPADASVGIAVSVGGRGTAETLLNEADMAMYQAKSLGGSRAEVFDSTLGRQVRQRTSVQRTVQGALEDDRVLVHYQPIVDLDDGAVRGFEALARIAEEDGSILPPAAFIAVAEESGLVVPLGASVLAVACEEAQRWVPASPTARPLTIAVNLSSRQFGPGDLTTLLQQTLERTGLDPELLHLELTETAIIDLRPEIMEQLAAIRDLGLQIGLDDFGTGYASLTHLRRLPLSFVKLDQSFVQGLGRDDGDERIVAAVVDLAANLGLRSIAEGVETPEQLRRLRELGCDQAQGYLFDRPLAPEAVPASILAAAARALPPLFD